MADRQDPIALAKSVVSGAICAQAPDYNVLSQAVFTLARAYLEAEEDLRNTEGVEVVLRRSLAEAERERNHYRELFRRLSEKVGGSQPC